MSLLTTARVQDGIYTAALDRLAISMASKQGVCGTADYEVTAGSGLQVNVAAGKAYVPQTGASEGTFYNGLYGQLNDAAVTPSNSVKVSATDPQVAQIILRVYDTTELGISGKSYARVEWLNGTPTAGATLENRAGAATLPQSSLALADVLVPANATSSSQYTIADKRTQSKMVATSDIENDAVTGIKLGIGTVRQYLGSIQSLLSWGVLNNPSSVATIEAGTGDFTVSYSKEGGGYSISWKNELSDITYLVLAINGSSLIYPNSMSKTGFKLNATGQLMFMALSN